MGISPRSGEKIMGKKLWEFEILGVGKIMGISQSLKKTLLFGIHEPDWRHFRYWIP